MAVINPDAKVGGRYSGDSLKYEHTWTHGNASGAAKVLLAEISTLTLVVKNQAGTVIVASRNVLNANGGTFHGTSGLLTMLLSVADLTLDGSDTVGTHYCTFTLVLVDTQQRSFILAVELEAREDSG